VNDVSPIQRHGTNSPVRLRGRAILVAGIAAAFLALASLARAHDPMSSWATARATPDALVLEAEMGVETARSVLGLPIDSGITPSELARVIGLLKTQVDLGRLYHVTAGPDHAPVPLLASEIELAEEDGIHFVLEFAPRSATEVTIQANFLNQLHPAHRSALSLLGSDGRVLDSVILAGGRSDGTFILPAVPLAPRSAERAPVMASADTAGETEPRRTASLFRTYLLLGLEHILIGYDHLLFLLGLLVACRRVRSAVALVTCFTLGHSLTLALAALDIVTLPSRVVEPLIAASIVYVGVENLLRRQEEPKHRWLLTLAFGLMHGFGFAGVLREIGFGGSGGAMVWPLVAFNLGVEVGQLIVAALAVPLLLALRKQSHLARYEVPAISTAIVLFGAFWFVQRLAFT
jgi:hydrogenase/urease accessory protein HupE